MKQVAYKQDRDTKIALWIAITVMFLYLTGMFIWYYFERNKPISQYKIHDVLGWVVGSRLGMMIWRKLFKHERG